MPAEKLVWHVNCREATDVREHLLFCTFEIITKNCVACIIKIGVACIIKIGVACIIKIGVAYKNGVACIIKIDVACIIKIGVACMYTTKKIEKFFV